MWGCPLHHWQAGSLSLRSRLSCCPGKSRACVEDIGVAQLWLPANAGAPFLAQQGPGRCQASSLAVASTSRNSLFEGAFRKQHCQCSGRCSHRLLQKEEAIVLLLAGLKDSGPLHATQACPPLREGAACLFDVPATWVQLMLHVPQMPGPHSSPSQGSISSHASTSDTPLKRHLVT